MTAAAARPSETARCPVLHDYRPLDPDQLADPFSVWSRARHDQPTFFVPELGVWTVTRYTDVVRILDDPRTFANGGTLGGNNVPAKYAERFPDGVWSNSALVNKDGQAHKIAKRLAQKAFLPRRINALEPHVQSVADQLIAPLVERGSGDLMTEFANPFTIATITRVLGLPVGATDQIRQVTEDALVILTPGNAEAGEFSEDQLERFDRVVAFKDVLSEAIAAKREEPDDGVISALVHAELDGHRLTDEEIEGMVLEQLIAGNDTAANMIGHALLYLSADRALWDRVDADRSLVPSVIDEIVRRHSPSKGLFRRTTAPVELSGVTIPAGELIHVLWGSANTDETHFHDPLTVDLDRPDLDTHLGFGRGEHRCLGSLLARLEGRIALETVFTRLGPIEVTQPRPLSYAPALTNVSLNSLQARWS